MASDRRFGVELEFHSNGLGNAGVRGVLQRNRLPVEWQDNIGNDGSDVELRSPILQGQDGFDQLECVMTSLRDEGCYVTNADGMHVHHDAPEYVNNKDNIVRIVKSWYANQDLIGKFVWSNRFQEYGPAPWWNENLVRQLEADDFYTRKNHYYDPNDPEDVEHWTMFRGSYGRKNLNISALREHGTIEIRLFEGTLDFTKAQAWIKFGQKFLDSCLARKNPIPKLETTDQILQRIKLNKPLVRVLKEKEALNGAFGG